MNTSIQLPSAKEQWLLEHVRVRPIRPAEQSRCDRLLERHHYLGAIRAVGERQYYVATTPQGGWLAILLFCAAAKHLRHRERWIGWNEDQRRRRLGLVVNNARFLILPGQKVPNLGSRILRLVCDRVSADWQTRYGHPVLLVETFVDPEQFQGTVYRASGWVELGMTSGWGRCKLDYYERHNKPKRLFVRELRHQGRRALQAEPLAPAYAMVEQKVAPWCTQKAKEIRAMVEHFRMVPDFRKRIESYPVWSLLAIVVCAHLCGAPRGQKDLAGFARRMSQAQRRALGVRRKPNGQYPAPSQPTFCRLLKAVDPLKVEAAILMFQAQMRGPAPKDEVVAIDGKEPKRSRGQHLLTAVCVPSQYYLGCAPVSEKTNEIPVARELFGRLDLSGRLVGLDALHTQVETARDLVQEHGADYLLTIKNNQKGLRRTVATLFTATPAAFFPSGDGRKYGPHRGEQPQSPGGAGVAQLGCEPVPGVLSGGGPGGQTRAPDQRSENGDGVSDHQPRNRMPDGLAVAGSQSSLLGR